MRVTLLQTTPTVGALAANAQAILDGWTAAHAAGAALVVTPELAICGYPPRDLLERDDFLDAVESTLAWLAAKTANGPALLVGAPLRRHAAGKPLANGVVLLHGGAEIDRRTKSLLPTYDVFDEARWFEPALENAPLLFGGVRLAITICEDIWNDEAIAPERPYVRDPFDSWVDGTFDAILNLSASPWHPGKPAFREALTARVATRRGAPVLYVNQAGANDELIFDGFSHVSDADGRVVARAPGFEAAALTVDLHALPAPLETSPTPSPEAELWRALVTGLRDYLHRTGFRRAVLGLSGGIDSAITAAIACDALGAENVLGVAMPSRYSSQHSLDDAYELARNLGMECWTLPIESLFTAYLDTLAEPFAGLAPDLTEENLQARCRGTLLMAVSNKTGRLLLSTGNKSEMAVGYATLYGDMCGGISVISDVLKTTVYRLAEWCNRDGVRIPVSTITKPPSAELRPDQTDQDSLPPYEELDPIIAAFVEQQHSAARMIADGHNEATVLRVIRMIERTEYKRRQAAPGLRVSPRAFGVGRRMPVANGFSAAALPRE